jgi:uncharacterized protein YegL
MRNLLTIIAALTIGLSVWANQNIVIVFDDSGSMDAPMGKTTKLQAAQAATISLLDKVNKTDSVGLYLLNKGWLVPLQQGSRNQVKMAVANIRANGGTPLGQSMKEAADVLLQYRDKHHYGTYRMIVLTDGEASDGHKVDKYITDIMTRGISVDAVGVAMKRSHTLAQQVTTYREANNPASLERALAEIVAESPVAKDGDESDYDVLAGLPPQIAQAMLEGLEADNHPIGVKKKITTNNQASLADSGNPGKKPSLLLILGVVGVVLVVLVGIKSLTN